MTPSGNNLLDPSTCFCLRNSHQYSICNKIKWSTLSIGSALLIIIVYLSSGLFNLIDVTTMMSIKSFHDEDILWPISSSSLMNIFGWTSVSIHFTVVLLIAVLLSGILLRKPCILFFWSVMMVFLLLGDGVMTVLTLREHQKQNYRSMQQIQLLFFVMSVRLIVALCGIFVTIFHFRRLNQIQSEESNRQKMLDRYNAVSLSPSCHGTWKHSATDLYPSQDYNDQQCATNIPPPVSLPRAKLATIHYHPTSTRFHSFNAKSEFITKSFQRTTNKQHNNDFRYNIPLHERFYQ